MGCLTLLESGWGVYSGLAFAFLTPPHIQLELLGHLHGTVISSSGSWWSGLGGFFVSLT